MIPNRRIAACVILAASLGAFAVGLCPAAAEAGAGGPVARATRTTGAIRLDGVLDEPDWSQGEAITSFTQRYPAEGAGASLPTEVHILFDDEHLYIGARLGDDDPDRIVAREMKEDSRLEADDAFAVYLDTFHDRRNGFFFQTNPLGARADALIFDEGRNNSFDWDGVWSVATQRGAAGWSVEMVIPFKTLHFDPGKTSPWGVQFKRVIRRNAEDVFWSPIPRNEEEWRISRAGQLEGLSGIQQGNNLELKPYALGAVTERPTLGETGKDGDGDIGLDARYAITPNLSAILTVNTDFAETEVDNQQVNITRFPLFFPEKREFFLESKGYFDFGYKKPGPGQGPGVVPFFSRRIGLGETVINGSTITAPIPILGGVKLAGRMGRYNLGFLNIETRDNGATPATNFTALRLSRDFLTRSNWGIIAVSKEPDGPDLPVDPNRPDRIVDPADPSSGIHSNSTYGADLNFSVLKNTRFGGSLLATRTPGIYNGRGFGRVYADWSNSAWNLEFSFSDVGARFNPETGFVQRRGVEEGISYAGWAWRSDTAPVRKVEPHTRFTYTMDQNHDLATRRQHWAVTTEFRKGTHLEVACNPIFDSLDDTFTLRSDSTNPRNDVVVPAGAYDIRQWLVRWEGDSSRVVSGELFSEFGDFFDGDIFSVSAEANVRVSEHLKASLESRRTDVRLPERDASVTGTALPEAHFVATIYTARLGVTFTTRMYFDALVQVNTELDDVSSNLRFNYKYRPGSDIYVVYDERRDVEGMPTDIVDRRVTVKWTYLLAL